MKSNLLSLYSAADGSVGGDDFPTLFTNLNTLLLSSPHQPAFCSLSAPLSKSSPSARAPSLLHSLSTPERALIGAAAGGLAGAFTYVCLLPIDAVKTKLQTKGADRIYSSAFEATLHTFRTQGLLGFYRGVSAVLVGSASSSAIYFGTCELGKSLLSRLHAFPPLLIPPAAGAMGNIVSSAIMVPKELITQRMQAGTVGRSWEVLLRIVEKDGIPGLYAGYSATLLRNLPAGILRYSSFEYLKAFVLSKTGKSHLEPAQSVCCGALAGAISASLTTPLDVVKTRLMTQMNGEAGRNVSETVRMILIEEGWPGLVRGIGPRVLHSACFAALGYFAFELARLTILHQYLQRQNEAAVRLSVWWLEGDGIYTSDCEQLGKFAETDHRCRPESHNNTQLYTVPFSDAISSSRSRRFQELNNEMKTMDGAGEERARLAAPKDKGTGIFYILYRIF